MIAPKSLILLCIILIEASESFVITTSIKGEVSLFATKKKTSKKKSNDDKISPMLAQWANTGSTTTTTTTTTTKREVKKESTNKKKVSNRREKQVQRKEEETKRSKKELTLLQKLRVLLGDVEDEKPKSKSKSKFSKEDIVSIIKDLVENNGSNSNSNINSNSNLRSIAASNKSNQYRMIWAASDNAICHLGSGLHNVPLARLQEVFISFLKSTIEVYEVIRLIGPFPNVKNTLKGEISGFTTNTNNTPSIKYTSMIDGTGKEVLAGKQENEKIVPLDVVLATENVIIWKDPNGSGSGSGSGSEEDFLVFIREYDMTAKLDILRVL